MDATKLSRCRTKLEAVARAGGTITYGDIADLIGTNRRSGLTPYLNTIYAEECKRNRPDLTVVVVYKRTGLGGYNSQGGSAQSIPVDPKNAKQVAAYKAEREEVYRTWKRK